MYSNDLRPHEKFSCATKGPLPPLDLVSKALDVNFMCR